MKKEFLILGVFAFMLVGILSFASAATGAPTDLIAENNVTAVYDEGTFSINWTAGGGDAANNYSVYVSNDGGTTFNNKSINNSATGFSFSNTTQGNYTFVVGAVNVTTAIETNSTINVSMFIDRTAPVISLSNVTAVNYTNATVKKNTAQLTLNISVSDANSGTTSTACIVDVNGTNQTLAFSNGWCNSSVINLTGLADGNQTISVYVNDTVNILGLNNSFVVWVDTTGPTATASCSPSTIQTGDSFPCTCSGSDASAGLNDSLTAGSSTSGSITVTSSTGVFTYTCSVTDLAGNTGTATATYTVNQPPTTGGNGGTSTDMGSKSNTVTKITPGVATIVKNFDIDSGVKQIQIEVNNEAQNVRINVTKYDGKPAMVSVSKEGSVYKYLQINLDNVGSKLDKATVRFQVEKSWLSQNDLSKEDVVVSKFNESEAKWSELATLYSSEDSSYYYYDVELHSFSYFAISGNSVASESSGDATSTNQGSGSKTWLWVLIVVLIVLIGWKIGSNKR